jgi:hypothetical protein
LALKPAGSSDERIKQQCLPPHALAGDDEVCGAGRAGAAAQKSANGDDHDDKRKGCDQIDVAGIVIPVADFPAH